MTTTFRTLIGGIGLAALIAACNTEVPAPTVSTPEAALESHSHGPAAALTPGDAALVKELKARVNKYHSFVRAEKDGYGTAITGCMENPPIGGMGVHYANTALLDGSVTPLTPEVLIYAPGPNGSKQLVGVEFIIPFPAWTSSTPPVLFGQTFAANQTFQVWALHVWTTLDNPSGLFNDWNPRVRC